MCYVTLLLSGSMLLDYSVKYHIEYSRCRYIERNRQPTSRPLYVKLWLLCTIGGKTTESVHCPCLRMHHRPSARDCTNSEHLPNRLYLPNKYLYYKGSRFCTTKQAFAVVCHFYVTHLMQSVIKIRRQNKTALRRLIRLIEVVFLMGSMLSVSD